MGDALEGDGENQMRVRLVGAQGITDMKVVLDGESGKLSAVTFTRPRETMFAP